MKAKFLRAADASTCGMCGADKVQVEKTWLLTGAPMVFWTCPKCDVVVCRCFRCTQAADG